jgi:HlyD family secretion protein
VDIARPSQAKAKLRRRIYWFSGAAIALIVITVALARLRPAAPSVDRSLVVVDTVKQGDMVREVRGLGTLVPEDIRWLAARTQGRVDHIILRPGALVKADSVILVLSNPSVEQAAADADSQLTAGEAELTNLKVQLQRDVLDSESTAASMKAEYEQDKLKAEVNAQLFKEGLLSELDTKLSAVTAEDARNRNDIEQKRLDFERVSVAPQLAVKQAEVDRLRSQARLRHDELDALHVKAGMDGVLQVLPVEEGAQVEPGANLARVADPRRLKAEVKIAETQAKDVRVGQLASIDTRNGIVAGHVSRVDPSVQNGTVTVDVTFTDPLPDGARPDLSVDGTIQLERLDNVVYVGRPAFGQDDTTVGIFRLDPGSSYATRTRVKLGRSSVNSIEIDSGLKPGDQVILSDMSQWDSHDQIRLN